MTDYAPLTVSTTLVVNSAPATPAGPVVILSPASGSTVSGVVNVMGSISVALDSAGSFLILDGAEVGTRRITGPPYLYQLDTTTLGNGQHTLQLYGHDIGNNNYVSPPVLLNVAN